MPVGKSSSILTSKLRLRTEILQLAILVVVLVFTPKAHGWQDEGLGHVGFGYPKQSQNPSKSRAFGSSATNSEPYKVRQTGGYPLLSQEEIETIKSLPPACQEDLPGLDFSKHKQNSAVTAVAAHRESHLPRDAGVRTANLPPHMMNMPNPHARASATSTSSSSSQPTPTLWP